MTEQDVRLRQLNDRNHVNNRFTDYPDPELYRTCIKRSARHIGLSGDIFRKYHIDRYCACEG